MKILLLMLILCVILFAVLGCDREAINTPPESFQTNVTVNPPVISYCDSFTITIEVMNWSKENYTIRYFHLPYIYSIRDDIGNCYPIVTADCIGDCPTYECVLEPYSIERFTITTNAALTSMVCLPPGIYGVYGGIGGVVHGDENYKVYWDRAQLIIED